MILFVIGDLMSVPNVPGMAQGALQGAIGWIMVASGLQPGMTAVAPLKLDLMAQARVVLVQK